MAAQGCLLHSGGRCATTSSRGQLQQRQHTRSSVIVRGLHHHSSHLTPVKDAILPRDSAQRLRKAIKRARQATTTQGETAVSQLMLELKRLELHQLTDDKQCTTISMPHRHAAARQHTTSTTPSTVAVQLPATHGLSTVQIPVPQEADMLDVSDPEYAPRSYEVQGRVLVCQGSKCRAKGALGVLQAVSAVAGGSDNVQVLPCKCLGKCKEGAVVRVKQDGSPKCAVYTQVSPQQVPAMLDLHFLQPQQGSAEEQQQGGACCTDCKQ